MGLLLCIGVPAYLALAIGVGKFIAAGNPSGDTETVLQAFDKAQSAYLDACKRHHGQGEAWEALHQAANAKLRAGL